MRHLTGTWDCEVCLEATESIDHLLVHCRFARFLWTRLCEGFGIQPRLVYNFHNMLLYAMSLTFSPQIGSLWRVAFIICVWFIWSTRNRFIFCHTGFTYQGAWKDLSFLISEVGENIVGHMNNSVQDLLVLRTFHVNGILMSRK